MNTPSRQGRPLKEGGAPALSVVIPCRDDGPYLPELVAALKSLQEPPGGYEVTLVDDGSRDGSGTLLRRLTRGDRRFKVLDHIGRHGPKPPATSGSGTPSADSSPSRTRTACPSPTGCCRPAVGCTAAAAAPSRGASSPGPTPGPTHLRSGCSKTWTGAAT